MSYHISSTTLLILAGILLWSGILSVYTGGSFLVWTIAKGMYVVGAVLFLFNK